MKEILENALSKKKIFTDSLFKRPESLSKFLPYDEYLPEHGIYVNRDCSMGKIYRIENLEHEPLVADQIIGCVEGTKSWLNLPNNCVLQVLFDQSAISPRDKLWEELKEKDSQSEGVAQSIREDRLNLFQSRCMDGKNPVLRRQTYLSIRWFPETKKRADVKHLFKPSESLLHDEMKIATSELKEFVSLTREFEDNSSLSLHSVKANELVDILRKFFNPKEYYKRDFAPYNKHLPISDQVIYGSSELSHSGIERQGVKTRTITLKTSPLLAYPGGTAYFLKLDFPFRINLNFSFPTKEEAKRYFDLKEFFLQNTFSKKAQVQKEEVVEVQDRLARGDRCLYLTFNVIVEGESDEVLDERMRKVVSVFQNDLDCEVIVEDDVGLGLCLNTLPLNYSPEADFSSQRYIRILRSDATKFLPIFDSFRGMKQADTIYLSRENNLVPFSLRENETSNHTVVCADSGSGKSKFVADNIIAAKRLNPEPIIFAVEKKSSLKVLGKKFNADVTEFKLGQEMPFSPFRGVFDDQKVQNLTNLLIVAIKMTNDEFSLQSDHVSAINRALKNAYLKKTKEVGLKYVDGELVSSNTGNEVEIEMDDVIASLSELEGDEDFDGAVDAIEDLISKLKPFYGDGLYAQYFKSSGSLKQNRHQKFYIYDIDALDENPIIQTLMLISIFSEISQVIRHNPGSWGFIILEEMQALGRDNKAVIPIIQDFCETLRKCGYFLIGLTPRPSNFLALPAPRALWDVADNFVFLRMSADNVRYLRKESSLLDEADSQIISSLQIRAGKYAEAYYLNKSKDIRGAFRFWQTPADRWISPTNHEDTQRYNTVLRFYQGDEKKAFEHLLSKPTDEPGVA